jgi:hypothetical protein
VTAPTGSGLALQGDDARLASALVHWLETGERPGDLFTDDVFVDLSLPQWRLQAVGPDAVFGLRETSHPHPGTVHVESVDQTARGFLLAFEERWEAEGQRWYSREMIHCVTHADRIAEFAIYCTGDWDEEVQRRHARGVSLVRS